MGALSDIHADLASLGHNGPPEPTPYELAKNAIEDLMVEGANWLDGGRVQTQAEADSIGLLLDSFRRAKKDADEARKVEAKPFDDGKAEVQARYKPLLERAETALEACKAALAPWLQKLEAEQRAKADEARREAEEKARLAAKAARQAASSDLVALEEAGRLIRAAEIASKAASKAEKQKAHATGGARAVGLRSYFHPTLTDPVEALKHYKATRPEALKAFLLQLAETDVSNGARSIPGFQIHEERKAV